MVVPSICCIFIDQKPVFNIFHFFFRTTENIDDYTIPKGGGDWPLGNKAGLALILRHADLNQARVAWAHHRRQVGKH
jgi:hypothetical protein